MRAALVAAVVLACTTTAHAFCGFYVAGSGDKLFNDATQVVLMRKGTRTVLAMQNAYKGPPEAFAMVVPVPVVLKDTDVKTLDDDVFTKVEQMGAPRLVEYWEMDPCATDPVLEGIRVNAPSGMVGVDAAVALDDTSVKIEAQFEVGEYKILILSASDSTGLETWLRRRRYQIPADAEPLLRPYVESGMKFFVAKIIPHKVRWEGEGNERRAMLSPLRFHYDSEDFALPIRLGLANSAGTQDLIVNILSPGQRFEVANYKNVTIPTNIDVKRGVKTRFAEFYAALFDATLEKNPGAVVTEYAWDATTCDPCPGPTLVYQDFLTLGADVLPHDGMDFVLTRLHARYGKDITDDLQFKAAPPIAGGREVNGKPEASVQSSSTNNFQGRYAIRHEWDGPIKCDKPVRGRWGGPPNGPAPTQPATGLAFARRGGIELPIEVQEDVPELGIVAAAVGSWGTPIGAKEEEPRRVAPAATTKKTGGCDAGTSDFTGLLGAGLGLAWLVARRRRPTKACGR